MNLPEHIIATEHTATVFTAEAKMINRGKVINYKGNKDELSTTYQRKTLPKTWVNQLYFEVTSIENGVSVIFGRGRWRAMVKIIMIDDNRRWATIQYIAGNQRTVLLSSCVMQKPHLVPIHFSCYESIQSETKLYYSKGIKGFQPNYLISNNYEARVYGGTIFAFRKGSPIVGIGKGLELHQNEETLDFYVKDLNVKEHVPSKEMEDPRIINTHWADKLAIRFLEAKRDLIEIQLEKHETNIFESENPE